MTPGLSGRVLEAGPADLVHPRLNGGCQVTRQTREAIARVFAIEKCQGFRFPPSAPFSPSSVRILGTARKTGKRTA